MALHDPESSEQDKANALRIGRSKKIQIIDGQRVEIMTGESEDEEDPGLDHEGLPLQNEDGQHYVVLEVIQLPDDGSGTSQGGDVVFVSKSKNKKWVHSRDSRESSSELDKQQVGQN